MRGSRRSPAMWIERTSFRASLTRRMRSPAILMKSLVGGHHGSLDTDTLGEVPVEPAFNPVGAGCNVVGGPADQRRGERGALPELVLIGLGDRRAEAVVELSLHRLKLLALALERAVVGEVEVHLEDGDEAHWRWVVVQPRRASRLSAVSAIESPTGRGDHPSRVFAF